MNNKRINGWQMAFSGAAVLGTAALCYPFTGYIGYRSVALVLLLLVSLLAIKQDLPAVITAALLSALVWDYFFIPPNFTLTIGNGEDTLLLLTYFVVAVVSGVVHYRLRKAARAKQITEERERSLKLYRVLFNSLSHDLRTPIATILGAADTLNDPHTHLPEAQRAILLHEISQGALRLNEQVDNLLNMSRIEAGLIHPRKEWCDVQELIQNVLHKLPTNTEGRHVTLHVPPDFPMVELDYGLTAHIVQNLLTNAVRHTPLGTQVTITLDALGYLSTAAPSEGRLEMVFKDNGNGLLNSDLELLFDKFHQGNTSKSDGLGLGLFVARGFTEAQGGTIEALNLAEGGACFTLRFPTPFMHTNLPNHHA